MKKDAPLKIKGLKRLPMKKETSIKAKGDKKRPLFGRIWASFQKTFIRKDVGSVSIDLRPKGCRLRFKRPSF
jgi:hypothetical protein